MPLVRRLVLALAAAALAVRAPAAAQPLHAVQDPVWHTTTVTPQVLRARLQHAAEDYAEYAPVPRIALTDIAYPADSAEADAVGGYALLLVTAVTQDSTELPLRRVYVRSAGREEDLALFRSRLSREPGTDADAKVFGAYRQDALYLLPLTLALGTGDLLVDYAAHRTGFGAMTWAGGPPGAALVPSRTGEAERAALERLARREYPELFAP